MSAYWDDGTNYKSKTILKWHLFVMNSLSIHIQHMGLEEPLILGFQSIVVDPTWTFPQCISENNKNIFESTTRQERKNEEYDIPS